jgi:hypothetical protein
MVFALAIAMPASAFAQQGPYNDKQNPNEYTDTEDGQVLKVVSYFLAPIGYALEWGVTRPLHYLATKTAAAPAMSGDTEYSQMYNRSCLRRRPTRLRARAPRRKPTSNARRSARSSCLRRSRR